VISRGFDSAAFTDAALIFFADGLDVSSDRSTCRLRKGQTPDLGSGLEGGAQVVAQLYV